MMNCETETRLACASEKEFFQIGAITLGKQLVSYLFLKTFDNLSVKQLSFLRLLYTNEKTNILLS